MTERKRRAPMGGGGGERERRPEMRVKRRERVKDKMERELKGEKKYVCCMCVFVSEQERKRVICFQ